MKKIKAQKAHFKIKSAFLYIRMPEIIHTRYTSKVIYFLFQILHLDILVSCKWVHFSLVFQGYYVSQGNNILKLGDSRRILKGTIFKAWGSIQAMAVESLNPLKVRGGQRREQLQKSERVRNKSHLERNGDLLRGMQPAPQKGIQKIISFPDLLLTIPLPRPTGNQEAREPIDIVWTVTSQGSEQKAKDRGGCDRQEDTIYPVFHSSLIIRYFKYIYEWLYRFPVFYVILFYS